VTNPTATPRETVELVLRLRKQLKEAERSGQGAVSTGGFMVDAASVRILHNILDKAALVGM